MAGEVKRQMGVSLDDALRAQLARAADVANRSIAEEIRVRLAHTFQEEAIDPVTRELIAGIISLAESIRVDLGAPWHSFRDPHAAFAAAVAQRIAGYGTAAHSQAVRDLLGARLSGPDDPPETIGRTHERHDQRSHAYPHLKAVQHTKMAGLAKHIRKKEDKS